MWIWILGILGYLFIGGLITRLMLTPEVKSEVESDEILVLIFFWPIIALLFILTIAPIAIVKKLKS